MTSSGNIYIPPHLRGREQSTSSRSLDTRCGDTTSSSKQSNGSKQSNCPGSFRHRELGKVIFFGDSFVRMFGLIEHRNLSVRAFKGATAKGLGRIGNENRDNIVRIVRAATPNVERLIFLFGSVDVHLSYFYKKYTKREGEIDLEKIAMDYVDFVASLPVPNNNVTTTTRTIVGIYPSPLDDQAVGSSLALMGSISEELVPVLTAAEDTKLQNRQDRVLRFNHALSRRCQEKGLDYIDVYDDVIDTQSNMIKDIYRDVSDYNIHVVWETTMLLWLQKFPWLKAYIAPGFEDKLRQTLKEYLKTKPWAKRTHVTQET
jgi:hypothetical protein